MHTEGRNLKSAKCFSRNGGHAPVVICAAACFVLGLAASSGFAEPAPARQKELVHLVRQDCGSCHGLSLQGGLGPALTTEALRGREAETLTATIFYGRAGTPMPPFRGILNEEEIRWIAGQLLTGFPQEPH